jgi:hypothetical protein
MPASTVIGCPAATCDTIHGALSKRKSTSPSASGLTQRPRHVADIGEAFGAQQIVGDVARRKADARVPGEPDGGDFRRAFIGERTPAAEHTGGYGQ